MECRSCHADAPQVGASTGLCMACTLCMAQCVDCGAYGVAISGEGRCFNCSLELRGETGEIGRSHRDEMLGHRQRCTRCDLPFSRSNTGWRPIEALCASCRALQDAEHRERPRCGDCGTRIRPVDILCVQCAQRRQQRRQGERGLLQANADMDRMDEDVEKIVERARGTSTPSLPLVDDSGYRRVRV